MFSIVINNNIANLLLSECEKFIKFKNDTSPENYHHHLNYLYSFVKLLFKNVRRPFALYEECLSMINNVHILVDYDESKPFEEIFNCISF